LSNLSLVAKEVLVQKYNYWRNTLSQSAIEENLFNIYSVIDLIGFYFDATIFDSVFSSIIMGISLGIPLTDIPVFNLCFNIELPTPEDFARGKLLDVQPVSCIDKYPEIGSLLADLTAYTTLHFSPNIALTVATKGYYGVSMYGYSYYDPQVVRDLLRSTLIKEAKRRAGPRTAAVVYRALSTAVDLNPDVADYVFTLFRAISRVKLEAAMSEYMWTGRTLLKEEVPGSVEVETENLRMERLVVRPDALSDVQGGAFADVALADVSFVADGEVPEVEAVPHDSRRSEVAIAELISREARSRAELTPLLVANYQTAEERTDFTKSRRADAYGTSRVVYTMIRRAVEPLVGDKPPFVRNQYNVAAQQLYSRLTRPGGWGSEAYRSMDPDTLKREWVEEWVGKGLDRGLLERLFDRVYATVKRVAPIRVAYKLGLMSRYMG